jgi:hypothetical protein
MQQHHSSTPQQQPEPGSFKTIITFLQCGGRNSRIIPLCQQFQAVCEADAVGSSFAYLILPGMQLDDGVGLADSIKRAVQRALHAGKRGLVLLTGCRGGVGLDVKEVGHVSRVLLGLVLSGRFCCGSDRRLAARRLKISRLDSNVIADCGSDADPQQLRMIITSSVLTQTV